MTWVQQVRSEAGLLKICLSLPSSAFCSENNLFGELENLEENGEPP